MIMGFDSFGGNLINSDDEIVKLLKVMHASHT
jgi:hypothetical protein